MAAFRGLCEDNSGGGSANPQVRIAFDFTRASIGFRGIGQGSGAGQNCPAPYFCPTMLQRKLKAFYHAQAGGSHRHIGARGKAAKAEAATVAAAGSAGHQLLRVQLVHLYARERAIGLIAAGVEYPLLYMHAHGADGSRMVQMGKKGRLCRPASTQAAKQQGAEEKLVHDKTVLCCAGRNFQALQKGGKGRVALMQKVTNH